MAMDAKRYRQLVAERLPKPHAGTGISRAFLVGGTISVIGQVIYDYFRLTQPTQGEAVAATLATMIFLGALLTAVGVYDRLGEWAGAGAAVPISGFANTVVAAGMDFRREGVILGLAARIFFIAGPVIVFGVVVGFFVGLVRAATLGLFS